MRNHGPLRKTLTGRISFVIKRDADRNRRRESLRENELHRGDLLSDPPDPERLLFRHGRNDDLAAAARKKGAVGRKLHKDSRQKGCEQSAAADLRMLIDTVFSVHFRPRSRIAYHAGGAT